MLKPGLLYPQWPLDPERVRVCFTTRAGGCSEAPYASLNLGLHVDDDVNAVQRNRQAVLSAIGAPGKPHWLHQVHGAEVQLIQGRVQNAKESATEADAAFTTRLHETLVVMTADCLPIAIAAEDGSALALVHAGWRSLAGGVVENSLAHFPETAKLHAWLGPAIGPVAFEVGAEVREAFVAVDAAQSEAFRPAKRPGHYLADLPALASRILQRTRALEVHASNRCTHSESALFFSHRRDGPRTGRMALFGWLEGKG